MKIILLFLFLLPYLGWSQSLVREFRSKQTLQGKDNGMQSMNLVEKPLSINWMKDKKGQYLDFHQHHYYITSITTKQKVVTLNLKEGGSGTWLKNLNQFVLYLPQENLQWNMMNCTYTVGFE